MTVELFLSPTRDTSPNSFPIATSSFKLPGITTDETKVITARFEIGKNLPFKKGEKYYFVLRLSSDVIVEYNRTNNDAASELDFEYVGAPNFPRAFNDGKYFSYIRHVVNSDTSGFVPNPLSTPDHLDNLGAFIRAFESDVLHPYLDGKKADGPTIDGRKLPGVPTIGVGIRIDTLLGPQTGYMLELKNALVAAVRDYPRVDLSKKTSNQVIKFFCHEAERNMKLSQPPPMLTDTESEALFGIVLDHHRESARNNVALGGAAVFDTLQIGEQVTLVSLDYNAGPIFLGVNKAVKQNKFALAGFELVDAKANCGWVQWAKRCLQASGSRVLQPATRARQPTHLLSRGNQLENAPPKLAEDSTSLNSNDRFEVEN